MCTNQVQLLQHVPSLSEHTLTFSLHLVLVAESSQVLLSSRCLKEAMTLPIIPVIMGCTAEVGWALVGEYKGKQGSWYSRNNSCKCSHTVNIQDVCVCAVFSSRVSTGTQTQHIRKMITKNTQGCGYNPIRVYAHTQ